MITEEEILQAGSLLKTHGVKGELVFQPENPEIDFSDVPYIICNMDGIFVPFFIEQIRPKSGTSWLILLQDIESDQQARRLTGTKVYISKKIIPEGSYPEMKTLSWKNFTGYRIKDKNSGIVGTITGVDDSTSNILFEIQRENGEELLIPANENLIAGISEEKKEMLVELPEGLLEL